MPIDVRCAGAGARLTGPTIGKGVAGALGHSAIDCFMTTSSHRFLEKNARDGRSTQAHWLKNGDTDKTIKNKGENACSGWW
jgi:hypothetical protein